MQSTSHQISASFYKIYSENYQWLNRWLRRHLQSTHNLEDIVQDTFLKLFISQKAHLIREPKVYLVSMARCIAIDQVRHELVEKRYQQYIQSTYEEEVYHSPEQMVIVLELLHRIALAVSDLPERPRKCLLMYYLEALPQEQIAKQLKVSRRTVQLDLVKAMVHCHQWISEHQ